MNLFPTLLILSNVNDWIILEINSFIFEYAKPFRLCQGRIWKKNLRKKLQIFQKFQENPERTRLFQNEEHLSRNEGETSCCMLIALAMKRWEASVSLIFFRSLLRHAHL